MVSVAGKDGNHKRGENAKQQEVTLAAIASIYISCDEQLRHPLLQITCHSSVS
jgi:hypothetical protein